MDKKSIFKVICAVLLLLLFSNSEVLAVTGPTVSVSAPAFASGVITVSIDYNFPDDNCILDVAVSSLVVHPYNGFMLKGSKGTLNLTLDTTYWPDGVSTIKTVAFYNNMVGFRAIDSKTIQTYNTPQISIASPSGAARGVVEFTIPYKFPSSTAPYGLFWAYLDNSLSTIGSAKIPLSPAAPTEGNWVFSYDTSYWGDGPHTIKIVAKMGVCHTCSSIRIPSSSKITSITTNNSVILRIISPSGVVRGVVNAEIEYDFPSTTYYQPGCVSLEYKSIWNWPIIASTTVNLSPTQSTKGTWRFPLDLSKFADNTYTFKAKAVYRKTNEQTTLIKVANKIPADKMAPQSKTTTVGEPINVANGNMITSKTDFSIPAREIPLELSRTYNSQDNFNGSFGWGWRSNYDITLTEQTDLSIIEVDEKGVYSIYMRSSLTGIYFSSPGNYSVLTKNAAGTYTILRKEGRKLYFDTNGRLIKIEGRSGNAVNILRLANGVISEVSDSANRKLLFTQDSAGRIIQISDPAGRIFKYEYDANANLIKTLGPLDNQAFYQYDTAHNLTRLTDANNHALYFEYDSFDRAYHTFQDDRNDEVTLSFNPAAKTSSSTDSLGNTTKYEYNEYGLVGKITDSQNKVQSFTWDANLNKTSMTNQNGFTTSFTYDNKANLLSVKDPLNNTTTFTYEPNFSLVSSITDALGNTTEYLYDTKGNLVQVEDALKNITTHSYDSLGSLIRTEDANNNFTTFSYDTYGNLIVLTKALENSTKFNYDLLGNSIRVTDALGNSTNFGYDLLNRLEQVTYQDGSKVSYTYDAVGNLILSTDAANQKTTYVYDVVDRLIQVTDALGNITKFTYDKEDNKLSVTDANQNTTQYIYDSLKRLIRSADAFNKQTGYTYDSVGNLISVTNANGNVTSYTYDAGNRRTQITYPDNSKEEYSYDANANLVAKTAPNGKTIYYEYDGLNRLVKKGLLPKGAAPDNDVSYVYDKGSRLTRVTDKNGTIAYEFDALNRMTKVIYPDGKPVAYAYAYDNNSNRASMTYPDSSYINYEYDPLNRLTAIKDASANLVASYTYDVLSRREQLSYANGTQTVYTYDSANRLTQLANQITGQPANFSQYDYTYDKVGNRLTKEERRGTNAIARTSYAYDKIYQLIQSTVDSPQSTVNYNYDALGNRISTVNGGTTNYVANNLNQYTQIGSIIYAYDANGNLINDGIKTYVYDYENRLTSVIAGESEASYSYDAFGRRLKKDDGRGTITQYLYDGDQIIAEYDGAGNLQKKYIYGPGIDQPVCVITRSGSDEAIHYYHFDGLGSVTNLTDSSGAVVETYSYDDFGKPTIKDAAGFTLQVSSLGNRFMFTTREYDNETKLYYYRARYYNTSIGRFLQRYPAGYAADINLYRYCLNAPNNWIDPLGLCKEKTWWKEGWDWTWYNLLEPPYNTLFYPGYNYGEFIWGEKNLRSFYGASLDGVWLISGVSGAIEMVSVSATPYWQYYPSGNQNYTSPYLVRGSTPPYNTGKEAYNALRLDLARRSNPGTAVKQIKVNWWEYIAGPRKVKGGTGLEYFRGSFFFPKN